MTDKADKKIYWVEGVTKKEVIEYLTDDKPSVFRNQSNRKALVAALSISIIFLTLTILIDHPKIKSYAEFFLMAAILLFYILLRKAVRLLADAPSELLDERQIQLRNNAYLYAYRWMTYIVLVYFCCYFVINRDSSFALFSKDENHFPILLFSICAWMASLPSMVLAWCMTSEKNE